MITKTDVFVQGELIESVKDATADSGATLAPLSAALKRPLLVGKDVSETALARSGNHRHGRQVAAL